MSVPSALESVRVDDGETSRDREWPSAVPGVQAVGVDWLGDVPSHWEVEPNRALFEEVNEREHPDEPLLSVTITQGVLRKLNSWPTARRRIVLSWTSLRTSSYDLAISHTTRCELGKGPSGFPRTKGL